MRRGKRIPKFKNDSEAADFWETHSLADYWEQTEPARFQIARHAGHRYLVPVDRQLLNRAQKIAHLRGLSTESLINLLLEQRLTAVEASK
jgi:hypothetical protein